jgi:hypothetical protein
MNMHDNEMGNRYTGWCPNAHARVRNAEVLPDDGAVVPSAGGSFTDRAIHWLALLRNQTTLFAIGAFCAGLYIFAGLGGWSDLNLFIVGMLAGLPFSAIAGIWYWRLFNEVLHDGPVVLWNRYDKTSGTLTVLTIVVSTCVPALVLLGAIPGLDLNMTNAIFGGFVAVSFWGMLIGIQKWESGTHRRLHYDGMILELEKDGDACTSLTH